MLLFDSNMLKLTLNICLFDYIGMNSTNNITGIKGVIVGKGNTIQY